MMLFLLVVGSLHMCRAQPSECNYVIPQDEELNLAYAVGVCRNNVESNVVTSSRKFVCNDAQEIEDEVYEDADCVGNSTTEPVTTSHFRCGAIGECSYVSVQRPCSADTYIVRPVLAETCYYSDPLSFQFTCPSFEIQMGVNTCPTSSYTLNQGSLTQGECD
eukprot:CAMPEP_0202705106 /NCGR_PEP_ID=MMETSP1385-20130828/17700_1 /ASSEMBLY_ACC=CAM_ASM_000861 /TAXON_ID=933848 /ORGANISM="Elphidium margaritaceum" /LENGTH=161 /DNA_ID=CAMNT_0049363267 /DNA_START=15 /DNA_END=497 /DNA_ORIENTATION=+